MAAGFDAACDGLGDYVGFSYLFRGRWYLRYNWSLVKQDLGWKEIKGNWPGVVERFPDGLDAAFNGQGDFEGRTLFVRGSRVLVYDWHEQANRVVDEFSLTDLGLPEPFASKIDAALEGREKWSNRVYLFNGTNHLAYEFGKGVVSEGDLTGWKAPAGKNMNDFFPEGFDAACNGSGSRARYGYFFRGDEYVRYNWASELIDPPRVRPITDMRMEAPSGGPAVATTRSTPKRRPDSKHMEVGFNYPWAWDAFGIYFGGGDPPGSDAAFDRWTDDLRTHLAFLSTTLQIRHVRIFLLCNAWNYGQITSQPPPTNAIGQTVHTPGRDKLSLPSKLHTKFSEHLKAMLAAFESQEMLALPSLLSFDAFLPSSMAGGGRTNIATDPKIRSAFLSQVLDEFLMVSKPYSDSIYAWEIVNEPVWVTSKLHGKMLAMFKKGGKLKGDADVSVADMSAFIDDAIERVRRAGFRSTVGHRYYADLSGRLPNGDVRQFHYYPQNVAGVTLPYSDPNPLPTFAESEAIVGEFSCKLPGQGEGDPWPELLRADTLDVPSAVQQRLMLLNKKGYRLAFLWPDVLPTKPFSPDPLKLSPEAQEGVKRYHASL